MTPRVFHAISLYAAGSRHASTWSTLHSQTPNYLAMAKEGVKQYYQAKIEECELTINEKTQNLRRLEAQRNALNAKGMTFPMAILIVS